ncbi:hypothetical protein [Paenibacillus sp. 1A_MP2]|uniref:hypothetical protein n=1 Tax=Paenibacillus sp. 1A_MP2 TaxID=3457495 RepID=UPI003FCC8794
MAPMFITMALYVGAMIYSMQSVGGLRSLQQQMGKWKAFFSLRLVNLLISLIAPLIAIGIYFMVQGYGMETFMKLWLLHSVQLFVCIEFTSIFIMLLGQGGMLINLPILLSQTIANGTTMPPEMMPGYFKFMSHITPMFYSTHLDYNILFGGENLGLRNGFGVGWSCSIGNQHRNSSVQKCPPNRCYEGDCTTVCYGLK